MNRTESEWYMKAITWQPGMWFHPKGLNSLWDSRYKTFAHMTGQIYVIVYYHHCHQGITRFMYTWRKQFGVLTIENIRVDSITVVYINLIKSTQRWHYRTVDIRLHVIAPNHAGFLSTSYAPTITEPYSQYRKEASISSCISKGCEPVIQAMFIFAHVDQYFSEGTHDYIHTH